MMTYKENVYIFCRKKQYAHSSVHRPLAVDILPVDGQG